MQAARYLNVVLTIIAVELGWLAVSHMGIPVAAQQAAVTRVVIAGVEMRSEPVPVVVRGADVPLKIEADKALKIEADPPLRIQEPLTVRIPVTSSPIPGQ